jgi:hypothetical protein
LWAAVLAIIGLFVSAEAAAAPDPPKVSYAHALMDSGWVRFTRGPDHRFYFAVTVNGHPALAMLDNGLPHTVIDAGFAASIGLAGPKGLPASHGAWTVASELRGAELGVGRMTIDGIQLATANLAAPNGKAQAQLILGDDVFDTAIVDIDFGRGIEFADPSGFHYPYPATPIDLVRDGEAWLAPGSIEGGPPALFALNLTLFDWVWLSPAYASSRGLPGGRRAEAAQLTVDGAVVPAVRASLRGIKFEHLVLAPVAVAIPQSWPTALFGSQAQGVVGIGVLQNFELVVDLAHNRISFMRLNEPGREDDPDLAPHSTF